MVSRPCASRSSTRAARPPSPRRTASGRMPSVDLARGAVGERHAAPRRSRERRAAASPREQIDRRRSDEAGDEEAVGTVIERVGGADLLDPPLAHADDAVGHRRRFDLVVGDEDGGHAEAPLQSPDLAAHGEAQRRVEIRQRLVEEQQLRLLDQRAGERDPLLLAARHFGGPPLEQILDLDQRRDVRRPRDPPLPARAA